MICEYDEWLYEKLKKEEALEIKEGLEILKEKALLLIDSLQVSKRTMYIDGMAWVIATF